LTILEGIFGSRITSLNPEGIKKLQFGLGVLKDTSGFEKYFSEHLFQNIKEKRKAFSIMVNPKGTILTSFHLTSMS